MAFEVHEEPMPDANPDISLSAITARVLLTAMVYAGSITSEQMEDALTQMVYWWNNS